MKNILIILEGKVTYRDNKMPEKLIINVIAHIKFAPIKSTWNEVSQGIKPHLPINFKVFFFFFNTLNSIWFSNAIMKHNIKFLIF